MSEDQPQPTEDERPKKFRITRKRLGTIRFIDPKGDYGFIEAEDFREDVFFHHTVWQFGGAESEGPVELRQNNSEQPRKLVPEELVTKFVEFEIDDEIFESEQRLRAKAVRLTKRPKGRKLSGRDATFNVVTHHPKARRKRPDWRN
ncbi:Cold-shock DNA-binding domain protein [Stieleria maiorica]|uniref:Cold-shock DNA-binding domain protein n=1 Tax=Stieleria maiorica TaxID=2795974 RepID=A0A5B9MA30_9BACT|nr:cold shock domain-containing protein [Stieleria maiorica]QEF96385.1 Cold-shock DNA-binding domain protein [Stieleria maiorica]